jgi:hypothetical protein
MERTHDLGVAAGGAELGPAAGGTSGGITAGLIAFNWFIWVAVLLLVPAGWLAAPAWHGLPGALLLYVAAAAAVAVVIGYRHRRRLCPVPRPPP